MSVNEDKNIGGAVVEIKTGQGFTPGPWWIGHTAGSVDRARAIFGSDGSVAIAEVIGFPLRKEKQAKANERLIAAAPSLYEAATFARSVLAANPMELSERMAIEKLDAALALANIPGRRAHGQASQSESV